MQQGFLEFREVWKKFQRGRMHDSLRDFLPAVARSLLPGRAARSPLRPSEFWALQQLSFRVEPGESLGIIGRNGAGKSTALKLLTRVLRPTRGECRVRGRIGALVEVGAGFHPDLTGRENVQLQGAIMGMSRADVARKFDDIVAFAGIAEFIDTPVKRYSTGMHARLGFSIAAHLDPDVLIIDEILSVGDLGFQTQAFARIRDLARSGRPVVVVSHQLPRIEELCTHAILLERGVMVFEGPPRECIARYISAGGQKAELVADGSPVVFESVTLENGDIVQSGDVLRLRVTGTIGEASVPDHLEPLAVVVRHNDTGQVLAAVGTRDCGLDFPTAGAFCLDVSLQMNVAPGAYSIQPVGWDKLRSVPVARGPVAAVVVRGGPSFLGLVQMNASMTLSPAAAAGRPPAPPPLAPSTRTS